MTLVELADLKIYLGIAAGVTVQDAFLNILNAEISRRVETHIKRTLLQTEYDEYYDVPGFTSISNELVRLNQYPVITLTSVTDNAMTSPSTVDTTEDEFHLYAPSGIIKYETGFTRGYQTVRVNYVAGYTTSAIPDDIKGVVYREVGRAYRDWGGSSGEDMVAERFGDYSYRRVSVRVTAQGWLDSSFKTLEDYRKRRSL